MTDGKIEIRKMTAADIAFGMELKNAVGWNQLPADWERLIALEPDGCFVATLHGRDVGTATTTTYEDRFGWTAMVLVHPDHRRKGIGTSLLHAGIDYLEQRVEAVKLDATPMGKKLYDTLGFVDEYMMERWLGKGTNPVSIPDVVPIDQQLLTAVCEFDTPIFGADRSRLLKMLVNEEPNTAVCVAHAGRVVGYGILRPGYNCAQLGPIVAEEPKTADMLFRVLLGAVGDRHVQSDVLLPNRYVLDMMRHYRFEKQRYLVRMYKGRNAHPGLPKHVYAASGPEKG
jgi:GNAT superfamily N-acetyltransferase